MSNRLLEKKERNRIIRAHALSVLPTMRACVECVCKTQDAKTAEIVLKEVGEWLDSKEETYTSLYNHISLGFHILQKDIEALKKGEMPE